MIVFPSDALYKGTHKGTNFPLMILAIHTEIAKVLAVKDDGDLVLVPLDEVNIDFRFDRQKRTWISIDDGED